MPKFHMIGIAGCIGLIAALFSPIASMPVVQSINYHDMSASKSIYLIILSLLSIGLIIFDKTRWLWLTTALCLSNILLSLKHLHDRLSFLRDNLTATLHILSQQGSLGISEHTFQLQWGWLALLFSAALILVATLPVRESPANAQD